MPKYIDIHAHTNFKAFEEDRDEVISRALESDTWVINIGTQYDTSKKAVEMTNEYGEGVYACIGLHPIHTGASHHDQEELGSEGQEFVSRGEIFNKDKYRELAKQGKVVGVGECGLDYYHMDEDSIEKQKTAFVSQIELANELGLPLMLHVRNHSTNKTHNAYFDIYELIKKHSEVRLPYHKGVSHFFAGSVEDMKRFIEIGILVSFAGPITYKPKPEICDYEAVIRETPLGMILADTDSPYVAPVPHRGQRNEPSYVKDIVAKIAQIKGLSEEEVASQIVINAKKLFKI
ncbi:TPA: hydrolase TatD [Candidatus Nomurabacteria bacterium]|nr:hydrolase TatD [Candidatus Nomurabacteria bacterium]HAX65217.1 hydrolase TatD [Candidatus Nomurabacteria bacterium]